MSFVIILDENAHVYFYVNHSTRSTKKMFI